MSGARAFFLLLVGAAALAGGISVQPKPDLPPAESGQPVLEISFPAAFQRLDIRDGDHAQQVELPFRQRREGFMRPILSDFHVVVCSLDC